MKTRKFAAVLVGLALVLGLGFLLGMTSVVSAGVPPVTPTVPGKGVTNVPCTTDTDCVFLNYKWNTAVQPCCLYDDEGNDMGQVCERCWDKYFRQHSCDKTMNLCVYEDSHYTSFIKFPCHECPYGCQDGACLPEPKISWATTAPAGIVVAAHALMPIAGQCHEVGLDGVGIRLTACGQPELQTEGEIGEVRWLFWPGWGDGTHQVEWWDGDAQTWRPLLDGSGKPLSFRGYQLVSGETLHLGTALLWNTCQ